MDDAESPTSAPEPEQTTTTETAQSPGTASGVENRAQETEETPAWARKLAEQQDRILAELAANHEKLNPPVKESIAEESLVVETPPLPATKDRQKQKSAKGPKARKFGLTRTRST